MYRYARTRNRVHRVVIEGGRAFKVENCNLDDVGFLNLVDIIPEGQKCRWCWAGYVEPTPEQKAAETAENEKREESAKEAIPPGAKPIPLVQSTRRFAVLALVGAALLGGAAGVLASSSPQVPAPIGDLERRLDDLVVQVRVLAVDLDGLRRAIPTGTNAPAQPQVIIIPAPTSQPAPTSAPTPAPDPTPAPTSSPTSRRDSTSTDTTTSTTNTIVKRTTVEQVVVVTPPPAPLPTPAPTPRVCSRPGLAHGFGDRCRWPHSGR